MPGQVKIDEQVVTPGHVEFGGQVAASHVVTPGHVELGGQVAASQVVTPGQVAFGAQVAWPHVWEPSHVVTGQQVARFPHVGSTAQVGYDEHVKLLVHMVGPKPGQVGDVPQV